MERREGLEWGQESFGVMMGPFWGVGFMGVCVKLYSLNMYLLFIGYALINLLKMKETPSAAN